MKCCSTGTTNHLYIEGDYGADPFWCLKCNGNLNFDEYLLSPDLKEELLDWALAWGNWINWRTDKLKNNGIEIENNHNAWGRALTQKVKEELGENYTVVFSPSLTGRLYAERENIQDDGGGKRVRDKELNFPKFLVLDIIGSAAIFGVFYLINKLTPANILPIVVIPLGAYSFLLLRHLKNNSGNTKTEKIE